MIAVTVTLVAGVFSEPASLAKNTQEARHAARTKALPAAELQRAKDFMTAGQRKSAMQVLGELEKNCVDRDCRKTVEERKTLFGDQFISNESFQKYQEARVYLGSQNGGECLRSLEEVGEPDRDNATVLRLRLRCALAARKWETARQTAMELQKWFSADEESRLAAAEASLESGEYEKAALELNSFRSRAALFEERRVILLSRAWVRLGRNTDAIEALRSHQDQYLENIAVLYELGMLYLKAPGNDWAARKALSLFLARCKRLAPEEIRRRGLEGFVQGAREKITEIDQRQGV